jgi:radical SAM superfamily enzyme YgiQ (UPF0313 family)
MTTVRRPKSLRIALVAMSGVRVANPKLQELGLTLPGFIERGLVIASLPSLALLTVAALTPERHAVDYFEVADIAAAPDLAGYDVVAISTYTAQALAAYELCDRLRALGVKVVLGGLHATLCPDEAAAHADSLVVREAEECWPRLVADLERGELRPVYRAQHLADLSRSPVPRFELLDIERYNRITVQTQRGCPHDCEFCAASLRYGKGYRQKPVEQGMREIDCVRERWVAAGAPFIELADDNTFVKAGWSVELLDALAERDVRWFTETDVSIAGHPELLERLFASGCRQVLIGFEASSPAGLDGIDARNWKRRQFAGYRDAIARVQATGVSVNGCFILGKDSDGPEVFDEVAEFVESSGLTEVQVTILTPFPGTPLYDRLAAEGRLLEPRPWDRCTLFDVVVRPKRMGVDELELGFAGLLERLYATEASETRKLARRQLREQARAHASDSLVPRPRSIDVRRDGERSLPLWHEAPPS